MKPFDVLKAKAGHPVCTRDGRPVRIICFDRLDGNDGIYNIVALVKDKDGEENIIVYTNDGRYWRDERESPNDLMLDTTHTGYINIYKVNENKFIVDNEIFKDEKDAIKDGAYSKARTVKIEWDESESFLGR